MRILIIIIMISLLFIITSCSDGDGKKDINDPPIESTVENKTDNNEGNGSILKEVSSITLAASTEDLKNQVGGILMTDISLNKEIEMDTNQLMTSIEAELAEHLTSITGQTESPEELVKLITYLVGSSNYKEAIEMAEAFKPNFEDPYLPDPQRISSTAENGQEIGQAIILLDASSSMLQSIDNEVKMNIAKDAVKRFADAIGQESELSLVVYGHKGSESENHKALSCQGIQEIYPMGAYNEDEFDRSLSSFVSKGWTPLAGAINKATEMSGDVNSPITVYVVSDGVETCDGNPVQAAENFVKENENRSVNIIGFNVDQQAEDQLVAVSEAGNGKYFAANNADEIQETIEYEWLPSLGELAWAHTKAPGPWAVLDERDRYQAYHEKVRAIIEKERERYDRVIEVISKNDLVPLKVATEISTITSNYYSIRLETIRELQTSKLNEIDNVADDIKARVNKWVDEMEQIVKKE
ncbi:vWA domain-containing protein [Ornithinibacillus xuwenensis]|uniref:VWA domain-containing protein n=1 Tax=Ornithinibacillus xuwenensis TaxID=3144668 RepID=A0ABU9XDH0_9BACI